MLLKEFIYKATNMRPDAAYDLFDYYEDIIVASNVRIGMYINNDMELHIGLFDGYTEEKLTDSDELVERLLNRACYAISEGG